MNRTEIPDALLRARRADIDRIPSTVLKTLTRVDLVNRLTAAGEFRRRADVPHLDADLFRYRLGQASEVLTTDDPKRAAELVKSAGVGVTVGVRSAPPVSAALRKAAPSRSAEQQATLDHLANVALKAVQGRAAGLGLQIDQVALQLRGVQGALASATGSVSSGLAKSAGAAVVRPAGRTAYPAVTAARAEAAARQLAAAGAFGPMAKAAEYERKADVVTDPELRRGYLEPAADERQKAGV